MQLQSSMQVPTRGWWLIWFVWEDKEITFKLGLKSRSLLSGGGKGILESRNET